MLLKGGVSARDGESRVGTTTVGSARNRLISFAEFRRFLNSLGFAEKRTEKAWIFHHPKEGLIVFRLYHEEEGMDEGDLRSTRRFLDLRGLLVEADFDTFVQQAITPA